MPSGEGRFSSWLSKRTRKGAVLADGSTSILAQNDLLGSTVDPDEAASWEAREAASERGRQSVLQSKKKSIYSGYDSPYDDLPAKLLDTLAEYGVRRSIMPGGGIAHLPNEGAEGVVGGFFDDMLTPAGALTAVLPGLRGAGLGSQLLRGLGRTGSGAYAASGAEKVATGETTGERVLGGVEGVLGGLGMFAPGGRVARTSPGAHGEFAPWEPSFAPSRQSPVEPPARPIRGLLTADPDVEAEWQRLVGPQQKALPAAPDDVVQRESAIRLGPVPAALERPDLLTKEALKDEFTKALLSNRFDDLAVFEAEIARRGPDSLVAPTAASVPDAGVPQSVAPSRAEILNDPEVAAELARLKTIADRKSTYIPAPAAADVPIDPRPIRRRPAPAAEFEPVVPRETVPLETVPPSTGDDIVDAVLSPDDMAYEAALARYQRGEMGVGRNRGVLDSMAGVREARERARVDVDSSLPAGTTGGNVREELQSIAGREASPAAARAASEGADVRGVLEESLPADPGGVQRGGSAPDRALGGGVGRIASQDAAHFNELLADARAGGFTGSDDELADLFADKIALAREYAQEMETLDLERGPEAILRAIGQKGGISMAAEAGPRMRAMGLTGNRAELRKLFEEMDAGTGPSEFNKRTGAVKATKLYPVGKLDGIDGPIVTQLKGGRSLDDMAETLREMGFDVEGPNDLLDQIEAALVARRSGAGASIPKNVQSALEGAFGIRKGARWWDPQGAAAADEVLDAAPGAGRATRIDDAMEPTGDVDLSFDPKEFDVDDLIEDVLDTGEKQTRLPGAVGAVRQAEVATPEFEAPFALSREADTTPDALDRSLFEAPSLSTSDDLIDDVLDVPTFERIPANVRSFLTRQLGYTPDEINAMTPEQATAVGRARTLSPAKAAEKAAAEADAPMTRRIAEGREKVRAQRGVEAEGRRVEFLNEYEESVAPARAARAEARRQPRQGPVAPARFGERRPKSEMEQLRSRDREIRAEMAADRAEAERIKNMTPAERQSRAAQMASDDRAVAREIKALMDDPDPTPEKFDRMRALYEQQAEQFAKRQLKGGSGKDMSNEELHSFLTNNIGALGPITAANPKMFRQLAGTMYASAPIRAMIGAFVGGSMDDESTFRGALYGAAAAAATPSGLRALSRSARMLRQGKNPWPVDPRDTKNNDISWARLLLPFSPEGTVPELFRDVTEQLARLQKVYDDPAFDDNARAAIFKSAKPAIAQMMRTAAAEAKAKGFTRKAHYANKLADAYVGKLTAGQRKVKDIGELSGVKLKGNEVERHVAGNVYRVLVGYALDTAAQNLTQPIMTMLYVSPKSLAKAFRVSRTAQAKELMKRFDAELPDVPELAEDLLDAVKPKQQNKVGKYSPMKLLHTTDNYNRRVALLAGLEEKGVLQQALRGDLDILDQGAQEALSIMRKTQGHYGPMGNNPLYRGPVMGSIKPFMKYPFMFVERLLDAFQDPKAKGAQYVMTLLGAALGGRAIGVDLEDLLLGGGRPLGLDLSDPEETATRIVTGDAFPATRAIKDVGKHIFSENDHSAFGDVPALMAGRYPIKAGKAITEVATRGMGPHPKASGTAPEHSGLDDILSLVGAKTQKRGDALRARDAAYEFNKFSKRKNEEKARSLRERYRSAYEAGDTATMRQLEKEMTPSQRRSWRRTAKQTPYERLREQTPKQDRDEFDRRFRDRLKGGSE